MPKIVRTDCTSGHQVELLKASSIPSLIATMKFLDYNAWMSERLAYTQLDIGCGTGGLQFRKSNIIGIDGHKSSLQTLRERYPHAPVYVANAKDLPFKTESFEKITMYFPFESLLGFGLRAHKMMDYTSVAGEGWYSEFARVLKPDGRVTIWGDISVRADQIKHHSSDYFTVKNESVLPLAALRTTQTFHAQSLYSHAQNPLFKETKDLLKNSLHFITLIKK